MPTRTWTWPTPAFYLTFTWTHAQIRAAGPFEQRWGHFTSLSESLCIVWLIKLSSCWRGVIILLSWGFELGWQKRDHWNSWISPKGWLHYLYQLNDNWSGNHEDISLITANVHIILGKNLKIPFKMCPDFPVYTKARLKRFLTSSPISFQRWKSPLIWY